MTRLIALLAALLLAMPAAAGEPQTMTQNEFRTLIEGNTIVGEWSGTPYRQFFDEGARTTYQEKGKAETYGTWRITEDGKYCSVWPPNPQEACYNVKRDEDTLFWDAGGGKTYPSDVVPGKQMAW
ncbi:MAG: hypothetical protein AAF495_10000 [Pseudomonadota bacterium]